MLVVVVVICNAKSYEEDHKEDAFKMMDAFDDDYLVAGDSRICRANFAAIEKEKKAAVHCMAGSYGRSIQNYYYYY